MMRKRNLELTITLLMVIPVLILASCNQSSEDNHQTTLTENIDAAGVEQSCFGQLPDQLNSYCAAFAQTQKSYFSEEYQLLCTNKQLTRYFDNSKRHSCYWHEGNGEPSKYLKVLQNSAAGQDFKYFSAYSIWMPGKIERLKEVFLMSILDNKQYLQSYSMPANTYISNPSKSGDSIYYSMLSNGSMRITYNAKVDTVNVNDNLIILFDRDYSHHNNIRQRKNIKILFQRTPNDIIFVSTERIHLENSLKIRWGAPEVMVSGDVDFMRLIYDNAKKIAANK